MRHSILIAVLLMVCTATFAQPGQTYYYNSGWNSSTLIYNDGTGVSIGTGTAPASPFQLEIGGQVRTQMSNFYAETSSGNFAQLVNFLPASSTFVVPGSGNYYADPTENYRMFTGVLDVSSITQGYAGLAAAAFIFNEDGTSTGLTAAKENATGNNFVHIQNIWMVGTSHNEVTQAVDLERNNFRMYQQTVDTLNVVFKNYNGFAIESDNVAWDVYDESATPLTFMLHSTEGLKFVNQGVSSATDLFRVSPTGVFDIGAESYDELLHSDYLLGVNGKIIAHSYVANNVDWSDFVFEESYDLKPLSEVKSFIAENGHLPGVPSAAEVAENGINLAQTNATLLMKIEELTLYMLQQQEEIDALKQQLADK